MSAKHSGLFRNVMRRAARGKSVTIDPKGPSIIARFFDLPEGKRRDGVMLKLWQIADESEPWKRDTIFAAMRAAVEAELVRPPSPDFAASPSVASTDSKQSD